MGGGLIAAMLSDPATLTAAGGAGKAAAAAQGHGEMQGAAAHAQLQFQAGHRRLGHGQGKAVQGLPGQGFLAQQGRRQGAFAGEQGLAAVAGADPGAVGRFGKEGDEGRRQLLFQDPHHGGGHRRHFHVAGDFHHQGVQQARLQVGGFETGHLVLDAVHHVVEMGRQMAQFAPLGHRRPGLQVAASQAAGCIHQHRHRLQHGAAEQPVDQHQGHQAAGQADKQQAPAPLGSSLVERSQVEIHQHQAPQLFPRVLVAALAFGPGRHGADHPQPMLARLVHHRPGDGKLLGHHAAATGAGRVAGHLDAAAAQGRVGAGLDAAVAGQHGNAADAGRLDVGGSFPGDAVPGGGAAAGQHAPHQALGHQTGNLVGVGRVLFAVEALLLPGHQPAHHHQGGHQHQHGTDADAHGNALPPGHMSGYLPAGVRSCHHDPTSLDPAGLLPVLSVWHCTPAAAREGHGRTGVRCSPPRPGGPAGHPPPGHRSGCHGPGRVPAAPLPGSGRPDRDDGK